MTERVGRNVRNRYAQLHRARLEVRHATLVASLHAQGVSDEVIDDRLEDAERERVLDLVGMDGAFDE